MTDDLKEPATETKNPESAEPGPEAEAEAEPQTITITEPTLIVPEETP